MTVSLFNTEQQLGDKMGLENRFAFEAEAARQFALERYDILDSADEYCLDPITKAARMALDVPSAAISLIDGNRQWFKSKISFNISGAPRDIAFCDHTIRQDGPFIVENALHDARFRNSPLVTGPPFVMSYIGMPLTTPDGHRIGALCGMDTVPRKFAASKIAVLGELAELVIHELELRQQGDKDRLTGALTRSGFSVEVRKAISLHDRQRIISTLILFDIDLYTMVDRRSRCSSGNLLLASIIKSLIRRLRPSDCVGRIGGTQFAVLLTGSNRLQALAGTEEVLTMVKQANADVIVDISFSEISPEVGICDDWLQLANIELLAIKKMGRGGKDGMTLQQLHGLGRGRMIEPTERKVA